MNVLLIFVVFCSWFEFSAQRQIVYQPLGFVLFNKLAQLANDDSTTGKLRNVFDNIIAQIEFARIFDSSSVADYIPDLASVQKLYDNLPELPSFPPSFNMEAPNDKLLPDQEKSINTPPEPIPLEPQPSGSTYETFHKYFSYAKKAFSIGSYLVPGLGQYKTLMLGLDVMDTSWKTVKMYREGESWRSIATHIGKSWFGLDRRDVDDTILSVSREFTFIDVSSMDMETFLSVVRSTEYPPLSDNEEEILKQDIADIIEKYIVDDMKEDTDRYELGELFEKLVKFIALHGIIPVMYV